MVITWPVLKTFKVRLARIQLPQHIRSFNCLPFSMAVKTVIGSANRITFITEKDSVSDTSRPTMIPPSSCPHSAIKWQSNGTTDTQLTKSKKDNQIKFLHSCAISHSFKNYSPKPWTPFSTVETIWRIWSKVSTMWSCSVL